MSEICNFCEVAHSPSNIRNTEDAGLMVSLKFSEAFKISLPENFKIICSECLNRLNESFNFFTQVQNCLRNFTEIKPELVTVKVEMEPLTDLEMSLWMKTDEADSDSYSLPENLPVADPGSKIIAKKPPKLKSGNRSRKPKTYFDSGGFKIGDRDNMGVRSTKRNIKTLQEIFDEEISTRKFASETFTMDIPIEFKMRNGSISSKANSMFAAKSWSDFIYHCPHESCDQPFDNVMDLNRHFKHSHNSSYHATCLDCQKETTNYVAFLNHATKHHFNLKFCCLFCSEFFHNFLSLYKHYCTKHKNRKVNFCLYCGQFFLNLTNVYEHVVKNHRETDLKFSCDICGKKTMLKSQMGSHLLSHKESSFQCDQCSASFRSNGHLTFHKKEKHSGNRAICSMCGKSYVTERRLRAHMKNVHLGNADVSCELCGKNFNHPLKLEKHMKVHDPNFEGKLICPHCDRRFKYHSGFIYHVRSAHTGEKPYQCCVPGCDLRFYDFPNGMKHIKGYHKIDGKPVKLF